MISLQWQSGIQCDVLSTVGYAWFLRPAGELQQIITNNNRNKNKFFTASYHINLRHSIYQHNSKHGNGQS